MIVVAEQYRTIPTQELEPKDAYGLLSALIIPRPIAFVSTVSATGVENLAPFSFFVAGGANPPSLAFSCVLDSQGKEKDTLRNVRETGEFVVNVVSRELAQDMNLASASVPPEQSEWELTTLTPLPSTLVKPKRVAKSLAQFECRLFKVVEHGSGNSAARYVIGEVVAFHVLEVLMAGNRINAALPKPIARLGGAGYLDVGTLEIFNLDRP